MSAENFLGIRKINSRKFAGYSCWCECGMDCTNCNSHPIFISKTLSNAMNKAQKEIDNDGYEYGIRMLDKV